MSSSIFQLLLTTNLALCFWNFADFQSFYETVNSNIEEASEFILPTNNSNLTILKDNYTYDYGTFDFIIVGAGAAGSVLANRLSEIHNWTILLVEAGGEQNDFSNIAGMSNYLQSSDMNWAYTTVPQRNACLGYNDNICIVPRGKVIGGTTTINNKLYTRGNKEDYDNWSRMGNTGWSYAEVLPYFTKSENSQIPDGDVDYHGKNGELIIQYVEPSVFSKIFLGGMEELGYKIVDYNGKNQIGASRKQYMTRFNIVQSGARAFLDPIRNRGNLNITLNAFVTKIIINEDTNRAYGVEFIKEGHTYLVKASREVIISAGAINSPQLLILSGIGPKEELERISVDLYLDLPVGEYLQDHPAFIGINIHTNLSLYNETLEQELKRYLGNRRPLTLPGNAEGMAFINVDDSNSTVPNVQITNTVPPGLDFSGSSPQPGNLRDDIRIPIYKNYNQYTDVIPSIFNVRPKSRGRLTLKSNNIVDYPNIAYNHLSDPNGEDIEVMYKGVLEYLKLIDTTFFKAANASVVNIADYCGNLSLSRNYWYCVLRNLTSSGYHPVGTARMGTDPRTSVVNPDLLVHEMNNLRIIDASIIPLITTGNPTAPIYMIAEKVSDKIKQSYGVL